jgi:hypothetical protein
VDDLRQNSLKSLIEEFLNETDPDSKAALKPK